jgi:hypothetical protein
MKLGRLSSCVIESGTFDIRNSALPPLAAQRASAASRSPGWIAVGYPFRVSPRVAGRGSGFFTLSREEFNNLKSQIVTSGRVSSRILCDIRGNLKGLGYGV